MRVLPNSIGMGSDWRSERKLLWAREGDARRVRGNIPVDFFLL